MSNKQIIILDRLYKVLWRILEESHDRKNLDGNTISNILFPKLYEMTIKKYEKGLKLNTFRKHIYTFRRKPDRLLSSENQQKTMLICNLFAMTKASRKKVAF